jgi:transcription factor S
MAKKSKGAKKIHRKTPVKKAVSERSRPNTQIEFCQKCSSILVPIKKGKSTYLKCRNCGTERKRDVRLLKIVEEVHHKKGVTILEKDITPLPLTEKMCPKCNHARSHWWLQQTRSADEPPTQFFRCEKCKHTWREYK